jgi:hypothetical protein
MFRNCFWKWETYTENLDPDDKVDRMSCDQGRGGGGSGLPYFRLCFFF